MLQNRLSKSPSPLLRGGIGCGPTDHRVVDFILMHVPGVVLGELYDGCLRKPVEVIGLKDVIVGDYQFNALVDQPREAVLHPDLQHPAGVLTARVILQELYAELRERSHIKANTHVKYGQHIVNIDLCGAAIHELQHCFERGGFNILDPDFSGRSFDEATAQHAVQRSRPGRDDVAVRHEPLLGTVVGLLDDEDHICQPFIPVELRYAL
mmetsp:Transcript_51128/g.118840  ORF Transcript_51128/g.118840 Transcript_51128/m.118840 type:complete len:209 (+) Transcript_51128:238-864(+)